MVLSSGTKLGPYEIVAPLGAGGMGEVYRARDTRLERTVAIKILPSHLSDKPEAKERFEREARAISSLNHPNICHLYDVGAQDGTSYLVMEYLEGETLADRLAKGPLALDQALKCGVEMCEGLEAAHRSGVVHRDLKPGNVMLTKTGAKLMDFGLAKAMTASAAGAISLTATFQPAAGSKPLTHEGTVVGTFQYMSPEQLEGKDADARSDVFALGAVLYEMLTGKRAFEGKSPLSVASAIIEKDPAPISASKPMTPPMLERAVRRCLAKDPEERWQTARDLALELKWIGQDGSQATATVAAKAARAIRLRDVFWAITVLSLAALALTAVIILRAPEQRPIVRISGEAVADANLDTTRGPAAILSPDGTRLVFLASGSDQKDRLYVRPLEQLQATVLSGTDGAADPFFSPDGQWIGFFADNKLKKISVQGGAAVTICDVVNDRGASWGPDDTIVFTPNIRTPLSKVPAAGGTPQTLTTLEAQAGEVTQRWPQVLPGGKAVLFTSNSHGGNYEDSDIVVYSLSSGQRKTLVRGGFYSRYVSTGHIVYMHEGTLFAVPFDLKRLEVAGQPAPVLEGVLASPGDAGAQFASSDTGNFVYVAGHGALPAMSLYWMDRQGKFTPLRETPARYSSFAFSPDGKRLALELSEDKRSDIWVYELQRDTLTRLTFTGVNNLAPVWTPDGQRITYTTIEEGGGAFNLYWRRADGAGEAERLASSKTAAFPFSWRPDGKVLAFEQRNPGTSFDILALSLEGDEKSGWKFGQPKAFLNGPYTERSPAFSPDGRWLAYMSDESGIPEVYVRPFPGPGGKWLISSGGGTYPMWSPNGKQLFYRTLSGTMRQSLKLMVVNYTASGDTFQADKPQLWSSGQFTALGAGLPGFSLHPDGKRVAVLRSPGLENETKISKVTFIFNFFDELRRKLPAPK